MNFKNDFTTKDTKDTQKHMKKILIYISYEFFKETKAKFLLHKNFSVSFVTFVVFLLIR